MLEVRYNIDTKQVTGWWGSRHGNHDVKLRNRPNEAITYLDIPVPSHTLENSFLDLDARVINHTDL